MTVDKKVFRNEEDHDVLELSGWIICWSTITSFKFIVLGYMLTSIKNAPTSVPNHLENLYFLMLTRQSIMNKPQIPKPPTPLPSSLPFFAM